MTERINKKLLARLPTPPDGKRVRVYDDQIKGFGVVVHPSGRKVFVLEYGPSDARRRYTIGTWGGMTPEKAREEAKLKLAEVLQGMDPNREKRAKRAVPTFRAWVDEYMAGVKLRKKQPRHDQRYLDLTSERWGARRLDEIGARDVQTFMQTHSEKGKTSANRWLASVRACLQAAVRAELIAANPAMGVKPFREAVPRSRTLSDEEMKRLNKALDALEDVHTWAAFRLLIETGARKSEVLRARWSDMDLVEGTWRIPSPKAGIPQMVPLVETTVRMLQKLPEAGEYVIPGRTRDKPRSDLRSAWVELRDAAQLKDVTIHDLRRSYGLQVAKAVGLHVASKLLRHSDVRVTERVYAPLGIDELRKAAEKVAKAKIIPLRGRRSA